MDIAAVVAEIEAEVARRRAAGEFPAELLRRLDLELNPAKEGPPELYAVIGAQSTPVSNRPILGPFIVLAKRAMRRSLAWYVHPIASEQTRFNLALLRDLRRIERQVDRLRTPWPPSDEPLTNMMSPNGALQSRATAFARHVDTSLGPIALAGTPTPLLDEIASRLASNQLRRCQDPIEDLESARAMSYGAILLAGVMTRLSAGELISLGPAALRALRPGGLFIVDAPFSEIPEADPRDLASRRALPSDAARRLCESVGFTEVHEESVGAGWYLVIARRPAE